MTAKLHHNLLCPPFVPARTLEGYLFNRYYQRAPPKLYSSTGDGTIVILFIGQHYERICCLQYSQNY